MKSIENVEQYKEVIQEGKVIMLFTADWCPDCQVLKPVLPEIEQQFSDYAFYSVDRDQLLDLCIEHDVFGIPSFIAYENGKEIGRFVSKERKTKEEVEQFINGLNR
ncbi:thioredoxin [Anoxybacillus vitaminiphilus]|uniref:Thioredoxin n=1 Tax=Paranoxybacillus vitaminiphilus TaxID=581036 RepID=A0A327YJR6_9BACL|nr:thioredoxin family protein [Anoxybacillus vitaminiphilus]RAK21200.1 thioredoxin [Anoxybacillus vitaminiphilus]